MSRSCWMPRRRIEPSLMAQVAAGSHAGTEGVTGSSARPSIVVHKPRVSWMTNVTRAHRQTKRETPCFSMDFGHPDTTQHQPTGNARGTMATCAASGQAPSTVG
jgi:hypothetical protein